MILVYVCAVVLFIAAVYLFMIFPAIKRRDLTAFTCCPIAHRGIHDVEGTAENTLSAFKKAMDKMLPIELDVNVTKDGVPVVIHDGYLGRLCGVDAYVKDLTLSELKEARLCESGEEVPTLEEVLSFTGGKVPLLIELKGTDTSRVSESFYDVIKNYDGKYAVQSFNPYYLYRFRLLCRDVPVGILTKRWRGGNENLLFRFLARNVMFNFLIRPDFIAYRYSDKLTLSVKLCRLFGACLFGWTFSSTEELLQFDGMFEGYICEGLDRGERSVRSI